MGRKTNFDEQGNPITLKEEERIIRSALIKRCDSINYIQLCKLFSEGKFPGYQQLGQASEAFITVFLHQADREERWKTLSEVLKKEVLNGNILPQYVAWITDRHYSNSKDHCLYYGYLLEPKPLCDCKNVDSLRKEIALPTLKEERFLNGIAVPPCYEN